MKIKRKVDVRGIKIVEHNKTLFWIIILLLAFLIGILIYIGMNPSEKANENAQIANPASVYCEENGGKLEIRAAEDGSQAGICILKNGTQCDEWKYYRGQC